MKHSLLTAACSAAFLLTGCNGASNATQSGDDAAAQAQPADGKPFVATEVATFDEPWAMTFLPDGRLLVTEKEGKLKLLDTASKRVGEISGVPEVDYGGQGGFGDVVLHPKFASNGLVYLSYAEKGDGDTRGGAVARGKLTLDKNGGGALSGVKVIWRQVPKVSGRGHYGHRIAFDKDGKLWISSSERQKFDPAQDMKSNLGKIVRLNDDGSVPADNPFADQGGVAAQVWSLGHRNALGLAFDAQGRLWEHEMGPKGGDELNLIERGSNYGYPIVSNGDHYDGRDIPDHDTRPEFNAPEVFWNPVISPAGFIIYSGDLFPDWKGDGFIGGLSSQALIRIEFDGVKAREAARYDMGKRIREVEQGPDGAIWLLEDEGGARLLKLTPPAPAKT
ncbi:PQQ-dependent sugar dehydrogenase [Luteimonas sp. SX5]|uniref:PQQ-dependent sugar dehydrogenase n=1 Tax=Luteimonas galliterrae TaxID=2940486 RepID=A0ABT0MIQ5_9GAMM|nr:PQQ-dependent sugar dehydrogenase [Luteimonas galliterrae]MCL1634758.1 PQQ-dependent sugar dehydrogenase [Luteimonas galliterrae]